MPPEPLNDGNVGGSGQAGFSAWPGRSCPPFIEIGKDAHATLRTLMPFTMIGDMNYKRTILLVFAILIFVPLATLLGYRSGSDAGYRAGRSAGWADGERRFTIWASDNGDFNGAAAQVRDAKVRWNTKNGLPKDQVDPARSPVVMAFPDRNCIKLKLESGALGGQPIYCYLANSTKLIEEHSDVE